MKILIVMFGTCGDNLYITSMFRQIKEYDYPGCHLSCLAFGGGRQVLTNNPYVDEILEIPLFFSSIRELATERKEVFAKVLQKRGYVFDKIIDFSFESYSVFHYGKTLREVFFEKYERETHHKSKLKSEFLIFLSDDEVSRVKDFVTRYGLDAPDCYPILFECSPTSNQSRMNFDEAVKISMKLVSKYPHIKIILSSKNAVKNLNERILDGSQLSYRENAELLNYCKLLIGCSSGITWLNYTNWSNKIDTVQFINRYTSTNSVEMDRRYMGLPTDGVIEFVDSDFNDLYKCVCGVIENGFAETKKNYKNNYFDEIYSKRGILTELEGFLVYRANSIINLQRLLRRCLRKIRTNAGGENV